MTDRVRTWLREHSLRLLALRDTPEAIAGGVAIGILMGFTPLFGLKTLLSIAVAWVFRANLIATVLSVTLFDLALPLMPFLMRLEYQVGYWLMSDPHVFPPKMGEVKLKLDELLSWVTWISLGIPMLIGSAVLGLPFSIAIYFVSRSAIIRHRMKHPHPPDSP